MATLPEPMHGTVRAIYRLHEARHETEAPRAHLGASVIGHACDRHLWLSFRWAVREPFDGRVLRLFESGLREEERVVNELKDTLAEVVERDADGRQFGFVGYKGHFAGQIDGAVCGIEEAPKTWHVLEVKTHSAKNFARLVREGVEKAFPRHYAQMQTYMGAMGFERALYFAVCKDDDSLHLERVHFNRAVYDGLVARAVNIIDAPSPPDRIGGPESFECRWCSHKGLCHAVSAADVNCRTCAHSTPVEDGKWRCEFHDKELSFEDQRLGCDDHRYIPDLVPWLRLVKIDGNEVTWQNTLNGATVVQPEYLSREFRAAADKAFIGNEFVAAMKAQFPGARVVNRSLPEETGSAPRSDLEALYGKGGVGGDEGRATSAAGDAGRDQRVVRQLQKPGERRVRARRGSAAGRGSAGGV